MRLGELQRDTVLQFYTYHPLRAGAVVVVHRARQHTASVVGKYRVSVTQGAELLLTFRAVYWSLVGSAIVVRPAGKP